MRCLRIYHIHLRSLHSVLSDLKLDENYQVSEYSTNYLKVEITRFVAESWANQG